MAERYGLVRFSRVNADASRNVTCLIGHMDLEQFKVEMRYLKYYRIYAIYNEKLIVWKIALVILAPNITQ